MEEEKENNIISYNEEKYDENISEEEKIVDLTIPQDEITKPNEKNNSAEELVNEIVEKEQNEKERLSEKEYEDNFEAILKKTSFGTELREALERIADGKLGALIVLAEPSKLKETIMGGFKINGKFSGEKLVELSKMDGAIIVDSHLKKIYLANVLLVPNPQIPSRETGTRHQAAERISKQVDCLVIAVSQRTGNITIYTKYFRYKLRALGDLIVRLQSVLDSLDEQKKIFNNLINYLNVLEFTNLVTAVHVISVVQKGELIIRGNKFARRYLMELGADSQLLELRLKEIMKNVNEYFNNMLRDYSKRSAATARKELTKLSYDSVLDFDNIAKIFECKSIEDPLETRGYRILARIPEISEDEVKLLVKKYGSLKTILEADIEDMKTIPGINEVKAAAIKDELDKLKNSAMLSQTI